MRLRRIIEHAKAQNWVAICLDFLIVVAGILIALQISEWNERRHERARERDYLERIASELESSIGSIENSIEAARKRQEYDIFLMRSVEEQEIVRADPGHFVKAVAMGGWTFAPYIRSHTFEEMKSTGDLAIFRDKELLVDLSEFYTGVQGLTQWDYLREVLQTEYEKRAAGILTYPDLARVFSYYSGGSLEIASADAMAAHARMLERQDFIDWLPSVTSRRAYDITNYEDFLSEARSLRGRILTAVGADALAESGGASK